ncbi:MAG: tetratricopeptide repeat protein [Bryobacteraceae bacterium]
MKQIPLFLFAVTLAAETRTADRLLEGWQDRAIALQSARLSTDERIALYQQLLRTKPANLHYRNLLASAFIQKMRDTTDFSYVERADSIVSEVLSAEPQNYEALRLQTEIALERHDFKRAADLARKLDPSDSWTWGTLGDALIELGFYNEAMNAYQRMISIRPDLASYNRAAYARFLNGDLDGAISIMKQAIESGSASRENVAWCLVELGGFYFKSGKLDDSLDAYQRALRVLPGYHPAAAGSGRVRAAKGDFKAAIEDFRKAQASTPLPEYAAALFDLYSRTGDEGFATRQMELIDTIDRLGQAAREKANRTLALIYADHDRKLDRALELARAELEIRKDIYTYDALAWALYKNGRHAEAETAINAALQLSTPEPAFYYHAGMIASALGKRSDATRLLSRALALNPQFDFRQTPILAKTLKDAGR